MARQRLFTKRQVLSIRKKRADGQTWQSIATEYGVSIPTIRAIVTGKTYSDV